MVADRWRIVFPIGIHNQYIAQAQDPYWSHSSTESSQISFNYRFGFRFTVGPSDLLVNRIGVWTSSLYLSDLRMHQDSNEALIMSDTINVGGIFQWIDQMTTEFTLYSGVTYTFSERWSTGGTRGVHRNATGISFYSGLTATGTYLYGSDNNRPTTVAGSTYTYFRFGYTT